MIKPIFFKDNQLYIVDQTLLPTKYKLIKIKDHIDMAKAIKRLSIRGAPALGIAGAYGLTIGLQKFINENKTSFFKQMEIISSELIDTRPTAVNLAWGIDRVCKLAKANNFLSVDKIWNLMLQESKNIHSQDIAMCESIAKNGYEIVPEKGAVLTHCNTGGLATGGLGTALGVIIRAFQNGKKPHIFVDETRPLLQGARLTAWELMEEKIPCTLCTDNMAAYLMRNKSIKMVIVGADRIAANGDTANKIGTYGLAILAHFHGIDFYIAAPTSTIDKLTKKGSHIIIEERKGSELSRIGSQQIAPINCKTISPAFDVTPAKLITGIITEKGINYPPYNFFK